ncbi:MAG: hypothetical protein ACMG6H_13185 [Acidobacteriota bacterium]
MPIEPTFGFTVRFSKLLDVDREVRLLLDNKIHRTLSLFIGHRVFKICRFGLL